MVIYVGNAWQRYYYYKCKKVPITEESILNCIVALCFPIAISATSFLPKNKFVAMEKMNLNRFGKKIKIKNNTSIYVKGYLILHIKELIFNIFKSFLSLCDKMWKFELIKFYKHVQWKRRFRLLYMLHMHAIFILVGNEPSAYSIFNVISSCFVIHVFKNIHSR